jgi:hypothetical protein
MHVGTPDLRRQSVALGVPKLGIIHVVAALRQWLVHRRASGGRDREGWAARGVGVLREGHPSSDAGEVMELHLCQDGSCDGSMAMLGWQLRGLMSASLSSYITLYRDEHGLLA